MMEQIPKLKKKKKKHKKKHKNRTVAISDYEPTQHRKTNKSVSKLTKDQILNDMKTTCVHGSNSANTDWTKNQIKLFVSKKYNIDKKLLKHNEQIKKAWKSVQYQQEK
eukprot:428735_1